MNRTKTKIKTAYTYACAHAHTLLTHRYTELASEGRRKLNKRKQTESNRPFSEKESK